MFSLAMLVLSYRWSNQGKHSDCGFDGKQGFTDNGLLRGIEMNTNILKLFTGVVVILALNACTPTVKVAPPDEPITINLNVKVEHEIRVKIDKDLDDLIKKDSGLF